MSRDRHTASSEGTAMAAAIAGKGRPGRDRSRDRRDQTTEILAFAAVASGEVVADFLPFRGYYTRLFSALVGERGRTYAVVPRDLTRIARIKAGAQEIGDFAEGMPNITLIDDAVES